MLRDPLKSFQDFFRTESSSGVVLIACTVVAMAWANSPLRDAYAWLHTFPIPLHLGSLALPHTPAHWINDGLMAVFFLLVGLEIKREILAGELSRPRQAALPVAGALGGMLVPALLYASFNRGGPGAAGWGIPMATDIAFALGVLSLLGKRAPLGLKVFLAALAIMDDLGAVLVIAFFYTADLSGPALGIAAGLYACLLFLGRMGVRGLAVYLALGAGLWLALLQSGVHATLAGVLLAFAIPYRLSSAQASRKAPEPQEVPLLRLEHALHPWVSRLILPVFALVNAGVAIDPSLVAGLAGPISLGIGTGLLLGKPCGILLFSWLAVRLKLGELPAGTDWKALAGCAVLGGIGFTMSIFIAALAFGEGRELEQAKLAILGGSVLSGAAGWLLVRMAAPAPADRD